MFKLKSRPPYLPVRLSLTSLRFMWRWGFLTPLPFQWPLAPYVSQCSRPPQGSTSFPYKQKKKKHTHTYTHVLLLCALQVLQHTVKHTNSQHMHTNTLRTPTKGQKQTRVMVRELFLFQEQKEEKEKRGADIALTLCCSQVGKTSFDNNYAEPSWKIALLTPSYWCRWQVRSVPYCSK